MVLNWLRDNCASFEPSRALAIRALRHLKKDDNIKLFSDDIMEMRTVDFSLRLPAIPLQSKRSSKKELMLPGDLSG